MGPSEQSCNRRITSVQFTGALEGEALAKAYADADVFVLSQSHATRSASCCSEALASGLPIAAFPVMGPQDVIGDSGCGTSSEDLQAAAIAALDITSERCVEYAAQFNWNKSVQQFAQAAGVRHVVFEGRAAAPTPAIIAPRRAAPAQMAE